MDDIFYSTFRQNLASGTLRTIGVDPKPQTAMSNHHLPPEMVDHTVDFLHDEPETLKQCCLVSKSWIPRTRKHLFASVKFFLKKDVASWKETFPDPSDSPAHYADTLFISCPQAVTEADAKEGGWIRTFSRVVRLELGNRTGNSLGVSFAPFHNFSPALTSLRVEFLSFPCSSVFSLIRSFPLLNDITLFGCGDSPGDCDGPHRPQTVVPSTSPALTGSLELTILVGMEYIARPLLGLPNGLHFQKLAFSWLELEGPRWIMELVLRCSHTLECLDITYPSSMFALVLSWGCCLPSLVGGSDPAPIDLSKAKKLKDLIFRPGSGTVEWVIMALQTIAPKHRDLRRITIHIPFHWSPASLYSNAWQTIGAPVRRRWLDLDRLLVQFRESRSICPKIVCIAQAEGERNARVCVGYLLPEITEGGTSELVELTGTVDVAAVTYC